MPAPPGIFGPSTPPLAPSATDSVVTIAADFADALRKKSMRVLARSASSLTVRMPEAGSLSVELRRQGKVLARGRRNVESRASAKIVMRATRAGRTFLAQRTSARLDLVASFRAAGSPKAQHRRLRLTLRR